MIKENVCCRNPKILPDEKFAGCICITETCSFSSICLNKDVLEVALEGWNDIRGDNKDYKNENYRFIAYRQFIWWCHGHMGKNNRTPLPNCVLRKIREVFLDPNNYYVPYCERWFFWHLVFIFIHEELIHHFLWLIIMGIFLILTFLTYTLLYKNQLILVEAQCS